MKEKVKEYAARLFILFIGLTVAHLGVTLFLLSDMGADPFNVLIQGLHNITAGTVSDRITHGTVHIAVSFIIIVILLITDKSYIKAGTVVCMICGGPIIDFFNFLLAGLHIRDMPAAGKTAVLILGCVILAFGMTIVIRSEAGTGPNDLVAVVISEKLRKRFGRVRIIVDCVFVAAGALLGGIFGKGTMICAYLVGPAADIFMPLSARLVSFGLRVMKVPQDTADKDINDTKEEEI